MKHIYIHIGRGKTGTTTIQHDLSVWQNRFRKSGLHYIEADGGAEGVGHQNFAKSFIRDMPSYMIPPEDPANARETIAREIKSSDNETIVISSENLELADVGALHDYINGLGIDCKIRIIFFVRSQDELAESEYNQLVKSRGEAKPFENFLRQDALGYDFFSAAQKWERYFGRENIICRIYNGKRNDVLHQFLSCIESTKIDPHSLTLRTSKNERLNTSIGMKAMVSTKAMNVLGIPNLNIRCQELFELLADNDLPALIFDVDQARKYRQTFSQSNKAFTERYIGVAQEDLGGRKYSDDERLVIRSQIKSLGLHRNELEVGRQLLRKYRLIPS